MAPVATEITAGARALGHDVVVDPPEGITTALRWTCRCGAVVVHYQGVTYGSATEGPCPMPN